MRDEVRHVKVEAPACDRCGSDLTREPLLIFGPEAELLCSSCAEDVGEFSRAAALSTFGAYSWGDLVPRAGFVVERVLERCLSVLFAEEQVDRLRVSEFDEGVGAHESEPIAVRRAWLLSKTAVAPAASNDDQPGHSTRTFPAGNSSPARPERGDGGARDGRTVTR